jgi:hypothetical protein
MNFKTTVFVLLLSFSPLNNAKVNLSQNIQELDTRGFTIVDNAFSAKEMQEIQHHYKLAKSKAFDIMAKHPAQPRIFSENDTETKSQFWKVDKYLIMQAGPGRYEFYRGFNDGFFSSKTVLHNAKLDDLMQQIMNGEFTNYSSIIHSSSGSEDQYWHRDTNTLSNHSTDGEKLVTLDDFYFTILIPITVPFTIENGTTEFLPGTHRLSSKDFDYTKTAQTTVPVGSAIVFNGKINHRGKANLSAIDRPALCIVYHKRWYNDQYRTGVD